MATSHSWSVPELPPTASVRPSGLSASALCPSAVLILRRPEERGLRVEVTDTSPFPPLSTAVDELGENGRGVMIVGAVTDRWGWVPLSDRPGKTVWFECDGKGPE